MINIRSVYNLDFSNDDRHIYGFIVYDNELWDKTILNNKWYKLDYKTIPKKFKKDIIGKYELWEMIPKYNDIDNKNRYIFAKTLNIDYMLYCKVVYWEQEKENIGTDIGKINTKKYNIMKAITFKNLVNA